MSERFERDLQEGLGDSIHDDDVAEELWSALANVEWYHPESHDTAGYSFRGAGGLIAQLRDEGNYMDWYCCARDGVVSNNIARVLKKRGWISDTMPPICDEPGCLADVSCGTPTANGYRSTCSEHEPEREPKK